MQSNPVAFENQPAYSGVNDAGAREFLSSQKWPAGLQEVVLSNLKKIPIRFFICDDSGSMVSNDGHKLVTIANGQQKMVTCSRWSELTESLKFHARLAQNACAPSEFRLLNGAQPIMVGTPDPNNMRFNSLMTIFDNSPSGGTPLCRHISEVVQLIKGMEAQLRAQNQKAAVIIATDGESSDGDIAIAMRPLQHLPVWVVIRLCTDDDKIVNYWNNIDSQLELDMDVLDDLSGEAEEVYEHNPWLNYGEPMHRLREFGIPTKEIDLLDESCLSMEQIRIFCTFIFGGHLEDYPHPEGDWAQFLAKVKRENKRAPQIWSPREKTPREWINIHGLLAVAKKNRICNDSGCIIL